MVRRGTHAHVGPQKEEVGEAMTKTTNPTPNEIMEMSPEELTALAVKNLSLKKCPFCYAKATIIGTDNDRYCAVCTSGNCFASLGERYDRDAMPDHVFASIKEAAMAWNSRGPLKPFKWGMPSQKIKNARRKNK